MQSWDLKPAQDFGLPLGQAVKSLRRESGLVETAAHLGWWALVRGYMAVCHRLAIEGREHVPAQPPFVLVANHASHLDALVLAAPLPWRLRDRIFPVAAGDTFFEKPVSAVFAAGLLNALPLWRRKVGTHALEELRKRLVEEPCAYILFPEGTRTRDGKMSTFKGGIGRLVAGTGVPVVPCHLRGCYESLPPHRRFPAFRRITLRIGAPLTFASVPNEMAGWKAVARATEDAVHRLATDAV
jgi:1-acyl-sn-glycerol-3-phosphate acyltransferase